MVHQKYAKEELFRKMLNTKYLRYVCLPLSDGAASPSDLIVFQEIDRGGGQTGRLTVAEVLSATTAESESGPRLVLELEFKHMQEGRV